LEKLLQQPEKWKPIDLNGANKAADTILTILDESIVQICLLSACEARTRINDYRPKRYQKLNA